MAKEKLLQMLQSNLFISAEAKGKILEKIDILSALQINALIDLLETAETQQISVFQKILAKNPNFMQELEKFTAEQIKKAYQEEEVAENLKEDQEMADLEAEMS